MFFILKTLIFLFTVSEWQIATYNELIRRISTPIFPITVIKTTDINSLNFTSYSAVNDPYNKYSDITYDISSLPSWLFFIRQDGQLKNELIHHDKHNGITCNTAENNEILFHITTLTTLKTNVIFRAKFRVEKATHGLIVYVEKDKTFLSNEIQDFNMVLWIFPHPENKNVVIILSQGYIVTSYPIILFINQIKLHIENMMQNFGERLVFRHD